MLDSRNGAEQSRPETMLFACLGTDGAPAKQTTRVIWLPYATVRQRRHDRDCERNERSETRRSESRPWPRAVAQPKRSGKSLSAKVLLGNLISGS